MTDFNRYGIKIPEILLPENIDTATWSVVACDQYTQDREYWKKAEENAAGKVSTLNLILPEVYLNDADKPSRIQEIKKTMAEYIENNVFSPAASEFMYIERTTAYGRTRHGLITSIDLDSYEWKPFSNALIRATEATILDRIPPRMEIRRGAPVESPHIMLLANDPEHVLVEAAGEKAKAEPPVYDGPLMQNGGSITGWAVKSEESLASIKEALESLFKKSAYTDPETGKETSFLFAVGDGNHSLATAKSVWEEHKAKLIENGATTEEIELCPVKYALVEIVNIYDTGLTFEPIHRVIFNANGKNIVNAVQSALGGTPAEVGTQEELKEAVHSSKAGFGFSFIEDGKQKYIFLDTPVTDLAVSQLQPCLDEYLKAAVNVDGKKAEIDYIHGSEEIFRLSTQNAVTGILLPPVAKDSFFATINTRGPLPRKSFSMGEADEKRYYLECRRLFS